VAMNAWSRFGRKRLLLLLVRFHRFSLCFVGVVRLLLRSQPTKYIRELWILIPDSSASRSFSSFSLPPPTLSLPTQATATPLCRVCAPMVAAATERRDRSPLVAAGAASPRSCLLPPIRGGSRKP
jgi:hypothetical protein